ncbi:MAG: carboxylesterase family protein [Candidatus Binatus sp.]|jgi:para-nitrobenzyl esterase
MKNATTGARLGRRALNSRNILGLVAICAIVLGAVANASAKQKQKQMKTYPEPYAITKSGPVLGTEVDGVNEFLGIPYAQPPIGSLRWLPPKAFGKFSAPFEANAFGSECTQPGPAGSEDCLYLNVYTPVQAERAEDASEAAAKKKGSSSLPVMVFIHGGGLTAGAGSIYDPSMLVAQGVIVVTINYRLGVLGFLAQTALDAEHHDAGNYGFMDQQLALKWVKKNIKAFGGNPKEVTIFGESAGGQSIYCNLASPTAKGLFRGAIAESGSYVEFQDYFTAVETLKTAETTNGFAPSGNSVAVAVGCSSQTAACLRGVSADTLVQAEAGVVYPFVDGKLLTQTPAAAFADGKFNQVPVIAGTNHDEYRAFVAAEYDGTGNPILTEDEYEAAVALLWTTQLAPGVLAEYPYDSYPNGGLALSASGTDGVFSCTARNADELLSKFVKTYTYEFNDENVWPGTLPGVTFPLGAYHAAELLYLFNVAGESPTFTADQQQLSDTMISYWTQFAKTLNPNSSGQPAWSPYATSTDQFQSLVPPTPMPETNFNTFHMCDSFWNVF